MHSRDSPNSPTRQIPTTNEATTMCEHNETLQRARHELDLMWGRGVIDYGRLKELLDQGDTHERAN